eukprot:GHVT01048277.1.p1 GENE.GHVT01048277.1~~GHVT01048277.1.p1  ORF type:complete len:128 (+),score=1.37 GHVT01048277.1:203-586(+)
MVAVIHATPGVSHAVTHPVVPPNCHPADSWKMGEHLPYTQRDSHLFRKIDANGNFYRAPPGWRLNHRFTSWQGFPRTLFASYYTPYYFRRAAYRTAMVTGFILLLAGPLDNMFWGVRELRRKAAAKK